MGGPQLDAGEGVSAQPSPDDGQCNGNNFNSSIKSAKSAADNFLSEVKGIEEDLLAENAELKVTVAAKDVTIGILRGECTSSNQVGHSLERHILNQKACYHKAFSLSLYDSYCV